MEDAAQEAFLSLISQKFYFYALLSELAGNWWLQKDPWYEAAQAFPASQTLREKLAMNGTCPYMNLKAVVPGRGRDQGDQEMGLLARPELLPWWSLQKQQILP
jgi:hypothetical protein